MNLLGIEFVLLILGIAIIVWMVLNLVGTVLENIASIHSKGKFKFNFTVHFIIIMIGVVLIIVSQNI